MIADDEEEEEDEKSEETESGSEEEDDDSGYTGVSKISVKEDKRTMSNQELVKIVEELEAKVDWIK